MTADDPEDPRDSRAASGGPEPNLVCKRAAVGRGIDANTRRAVCTFLRRLEGRYAPIDALVFGSRARGTNTPDSDADLAVILQGDGGDRFRVAGAMAEIAFDVMLETGVLIDPLPLWDAELRRPDLFSNPFLLSQILRDGLRL